MRTLALASLVLISSIASAVDSISIECNLFKNGSPHGEAFCLRDLDERGFCTGGSSFMGWLRKQDRSMAHLGVGINYLSSEKLLSIRAADFSESDLGSDPVELAEARAPYKAFTEMRLVLPDLNVEVKCAKVQSVTCVK